MSGLGVSSDLHGIIDSHLCFEILDSNYYKFKETRGRKCKRLPVGGLTPNYHKECGGFKDFKRKDQESKNFFRFNWGDIASAKNQRGEFLVFGLNSYLVVETCQNCKANGTCDSKDHLANALILDKYRSKDFPEAVSVHDLNLNRHGFREIRAFELEKPLPDPLAGYQCRSSLIEQWSQLSDAELEGLIVQFGLQKSIVLGPNGLDFLPDAGVEGKGLISKWPEFRKIIAEKDSFQEGIRFLEGLRTPGEDNQDLFVLFCLFFFFYI